MESRIITVSVRVPIAKQDKRSFNMPAITKTVIRLCKISVSVATGLVAGLLTASWAIPYAASERGYTGAVGGEALLIPAVIIITTFLCHKILSFPHRCHRRGRKVNGHNNGTDLA